VMKISPKTQWKVLRLMQICVWIFDIFWTDACIFFCLFLEDFWIKLLLISHLTVAGVTMMIFHKRFFDRLLYGEAIFVAVMVSSPPPELKAPQEFNHN
jgi:hypothetical protein